MFFLRASLLSALVLLFVGCAPVKHVPVVVPATLATRTALYYPAEAARQNHQGTVVLLVLVGKQGTPLDVRVNKSSGYLDLDRAAIWTSKHWTFKPETIDGLPADSYVRVPINFAVSGPLPAVSSPPNLLPNPASAGGNR